MHDDGDKSRLPNQINQSLHLPGKARKLEVPLQISMENTDRWVLWNAGKAHHQNTKHDWQRHEKSLHLSLERWVCAYGLKNSVSAQQKCVFCGSPNPDDTHYEIHNYTVCQERSLEERTFYRKDHLRQHLRLVHDCQF